MQRIFDTVLASSDLSLDRVLNAGLPATLIFYEKELPNDLRQAMDDLARQYAGKVLIVTLARGDSAQAFARFGVQQLPALVTVRDGKAVTQQQNLNVADLKPHIIHLLGEGPLPNQRAADTGPRANAGSARGPINVNEAQFEREVIQSERPVLIDFWAPWCGPCHMVAPIIEKLAREHSNSLKVVKVNVDENPGLASRYHAMSIPTMIVIRGGREVDRWVGAQPEAVIRNRVAPWI
jgi:thioredoxin 1